jgi:hypothetical protein
MTLKGEFTEVVPRADGSTETMRMACETVGFPAGDARIRGKNGVTTMRITQSTTPKAARDGAVASGMENGMEAGFKQMDALLAQPA